MIAQFLWRCMRFCSRVYRYRAIFHVLITNKCSVNKNKYKSIRFILNAIIDFTKKNKAQCKNKTRIKQRKIQCSHNKRQKTFSSRSKFKWHEKNISVSFFPFNLFWNAVYVLRSQHFLSWFGWSRCGESTKILWTTLSMPDFFVFEDQTQVGINYWVFFLVSGAQAFLIKNPRKFVKRYENWIAKNVKIGRKWLTEKSSSKNEN